MYGSCPVYVRGKTEKYSFEDVLKILIAEHDPGTLCKTQPMRCQKDMAFLIDASKVKLQDIPYDDNGSYLGSGSHTWTYKVVGGDPRNVVLQSRKREKAEKATWNISISEGITEPVKLPVTFDSMSRIWKTHREMS